MLFRIFVISLLIGLVGCKEKRPINDEQYCDMHFKAASYVVAERYCLKAAKQGSLSSMWLLASMNLYQAHPQASYEMAFHWLQASAEQGHLLAQKELAKAYMWGKGTEKSPEQAHLLLLPLAESGDVDAQFLLGIQAMDGVTAFFDHQKALSWFLQAATKGHVMAANNAAWILSTSFDDSLRNGKKALELLLPILEKYPESPVFLDTLAAAYAEIGDFAKAYEIQSQAIALLPRSISKKNLEGYLERLNSFEYRQPWREMKPEWFEQEKN